MTKDKVNKKSSEGARSGDTFIWDPHADQTYTVDDVFNTGFDPGQLVGTAESFDKEPGYSFTATAPVNIVVTDHGTTTWGGVSLDGRTTRIEALAREGQILFFSKGILVIGNRGEVNGTSPPTRPGSVVSLSGDHTGMGLDVPFVEFSGTTVDIDNKSSLRLGNERFKVSTVTLYNSQISVKNGGVCSITPNLDARRITVRGLVGLRVYEGSSASMGGATWDFSQDSTMLFFLDGVRDGDTGADSRSYCYLSGFDFLSSSYYGVKFDFTTKDDNGRPLKNNGEYVFAGIGNAFQLTAMFEKQLITIDGVPADFRNIADDLTGGDLRIRLR